MEYFCCFWQTQQDAQCILINRWFCFHICMLFGIDGWQSTKYQVTWSPKGTNTSALLPPLCSPKLKTNRAMKRTTNVAFCDSAFYIHLAYSFTAMKSNTHSMWESFIILESKYPLKYLHFTVKRIAKHKVMYKLRYSSFWSMENGGRNELTTTNNFQEFRLEMFSY